MTDIRFLISLPQGPVVSGVTSWAVRTANGLADIGVEVGLLVSRPREDHAAIELQLDNGVVRYDCDAPPAIGADEGEIDAIERAWLEVIGDEKWGGVTALTPNLHHHAYAAAVRIHQRAPDRVRLLAWLHRDDPYDHAMMCHAAPALDAALVLTHRAERALARETPELKDRTVRLPYAVECSDRPPVRAALMSRPIRLIYTGRMDEPQKRVSELIDLARRLRYHDVCFEMRLIGDGPMSPSIDEAIGHERLPVERLPAIAPTELGNHLAWADAFILTSQYEGLAVSMLEAMGRGCVPIVTDVCGVGEVIRDGVTGWLYEPGDLDRAVELIADASDEQLARMRRAAWRHIRKHHNPGDYATSIATLISRLPERAPARWPGDRPEIMPPASVDSIGRARSRLVARLHECKSERVAIWGAGRHTRALADALLPAKNIVAVLDDDSARQGARFLERWPIVPPCAAALKEYGVRTVIISTEMYERSLYARREELGPEVRVVGLYETENETQSGTNRAA